MPVTCSSFASSISISGSTSDAAGLLPSRRLQLGFVLCEPWYTYHCGIWTCHCITTCVISSITSVIRISVVFGLLLRCSLCYTADSLQSCCLEPLTLWWPNSPVQLFVHFLSPVLKPKGRTTFLVANVEAYSKPAEYLSLYWGIVAHSQTQYNL